MNKEDIKYALKQMGNTIYGLTIDGLKMVGIIILAAVILSTILYCVVHWPWQFFGGFIVSALVAWFWMELDSARRTREWEEQCRVYWTDRTKPMDE